MKQLITTLLLTLTSSISFAAQQAITDTGEMVILHDNGTWKYTNSDADTKEIPVNNKKYIKPADAKFLLKSTKNNTGFWLNTNKWNFTKNTSNDAAEYQLSLKREDLYGMIITEAVHIPVEQLVEIALQNAKDATPDARMTHKEYRYVNGLKVIFMQMEGTLQGINFAYSGYYFSNKEGATQFLLYTGKELTTKYKSEINDLLNGLVVSSK